MRAGAVPAAQLKFSKIIRSLTKHEQIARLQRCGHTRYGDDLAFAKRAKLKHRAQLLDADLRQVQAFHHKVTVINAGKEGVGRRPGLHSGITSGG